MEIEDFDKTVPKEQSRRIIAVLPDKGFKIVEAHQIQDELLIEVADEQQSQKLMEVLKDPGFLSEVYGQEIIQVLASLDHGKSLQECFKELETPYLEETQPPKKRNDLPRPFKRKGKHNWFCVR